MRRTVIILLVVLFILSFVPASVMAKSSNVTTNIEVSVPRVWHGGHLALARNNPTVNVKIGDTSTRFTVKLSGNSYKESRKVTLPITRKWFKNTATVTVECNGIISSKKVTVRENGRIIITPTYRWSTTGHRLSGFKISTSRR